MDITIKRVYAPYSTDDGCRILIDRLWPRGLSHEHAHIDDWQKDFAPSTKLRQWFHHDSIKWQEFKDKYVLELDAQNAAIQTYMNSLKSHTHITFLYAAHDEQHNNAVVFVHYLKTRICQD